MKAVSYSIKRSVADAHVLFLNEEILRVHIIIKEEKIMAIFTGAGVAIVTPMLPTGEVNYDKLGELIEFQIENHTDAIIICGTTGESPL